MDYFKSTAVISKVTEHEASYQDINFFESPPQFKSITSEKSITFFFENYKKGWKTTMAMLK